MPRPNGSAMAERPILPPGVSLDTRRASSPQPDDIQVLSARLEPFRAVNGRVVPAVTLQWRNGSDWAVRALWGTIELVDERGDTLVYHDRQCVYAGRAVPPGGVVTETPEEGWLVIDYDWAEIRARVRFTPTRVDTTLHQ